MSDKYKFLDVLKMKRIDTPTEGRGYAETWPAGEPGDATYPRPAEIPINQHGVQVFKPDQFSEDDLAGEALHVDPVASSFREMFTKTLTPSQINELKRQPDYEVGDGSEQQKMQSATDAAMRGYLVNQWPPEAVQKFFTPEQMKLLDGLKSYMQTGTIPDEAGAAIGYGKRK